MSTTRLLDESDLEDQNQLYYESTPSHDKEGSQEFLIFMITGNPGLISYYEPFLSTLNTLLSSSPSKFYISGYSLAGFDFAARGLSGASPSLVGLQQQIDHVEHMLFKQVDALRRSIGPRHICPKVILIGHSVGAYILLELIRHHRTKIDEGENDFDLIGGILLFPTITHIAQSQQGRIYNVSRVQVLHLASPRVHMGEPCLRCIANPQTPSPPVHCWGSRSSLILLNTNRNRLQYGEGGDAVSRTRSKDYRFLHQKRSSYPTSAVSQPSLYPLGILCFQSPLTEIGILLKMKCKPSPKINGERKCGERQLVLVLTAVIRLTPT